MLFCFKVNEGIVRLLFDLLFVRIIRMFCFLIFLCLFEWLNNFVFVSLSVFLIFFFLLVKLSLFKIVLNIECVMLLLNLYFRYGLLEYVMMLMFVLFLLFFKVLVIFLMNFICFLKFFFWYLLMFFLVYKMKLMLKLFEYFLMKRKLKLILGF